MILFAWVLGSSALSVVVWALVSTHRLLYPAVLAPGAHLEPAVDAVTLTAADGRSFTVRALTPSSPRGRILIFHGYLASYRQGLDIADGLRRRGYEALLMELRGHGERPGPCTFGLKETEDALVLARWAASRSRLPLGMLGLSMGATIACQVASRAPEAGAVVLDSAYARLYPVLALALWQRYKVPTPAAFVTWWGLQARLGRRLAPLDPIGSAPRLRQPLLFIQGGADRRVAPALSADLYARWAGMKIRWDDPAIAHVGMFTRHHDEYVRRVAEFFDEHLFARPCPA